MATILDTTRNCSSITNCLRQQGFNSVIRYYSRQGLEWKRLAQKEAIALANAGLQIAVVYQNRQDRPEDFSEPQGETAGRDAFNYAQSVIMQPSGSGIYFSVDFDATESQVSTRIIPFFMGIRSAFDNASGGAAVYRIGVYGSGRTCRMLRAGGHAELSWLAQAKGWAEFKKYHDSKEWHLKQNMPETVCGIGCDPDETNPDHPDFGGFLLDTGALGPAAPAELEPSANRFTVIARDGLRLRAGPSTEFDIRMVLVFGRTVTVLSRAGDWAVVDLDGDGAADGFCHSAFLKLV